MQWHQVPAYRRVASVESFESLHRSSRMPIRAPQPSSRSSRLSNLVSWSKSWFLACLAPWIGRRGSPRTARNPAYHTRFLFRHLLALQVRLTLLDLPGTLGKLKECLSCSRRPPYLICLHYASFQNEQLQMLLLLFWVPYWGPVLLIGLVQGLHYQTIGRSFVEGLCLAQRHSWPMDWSTPPTLAQIHRNAMNSKFFYRQSTFEIL